MRILLADDQPKVRFALRVLLVSMSDISVVGEVTDADELVSQIDSTNPDMVILDWQLPGLREIGSILALRKDRPDLFVIALSGRPELEQAALDAGADYFVSKIDPPDRLLATVSRFQKQLSGMREET
jgi:DNA-binding NarL/FixJ family response regulator